MSAADGWRRPEPNLNVIWQRHVPQGLGEPDGDVRVDAIADLTDALEEALDDLAYGDLLDRGDIVLTLSVRPSLAGGQRDHRPPGEGIR